MEPGPEPVDLRKKTLVSFVTPVLYDTPIWGKNFGDCVKQPQKLAKPGDIVTAVFVSIYFDQSINECIYLKNSDERGNMY